MTDITTEDRKILTELFEGHQLYFVGGYVRDKQMGIESNDIDFATDMTPQEIISECVKKNIKHWYTENSLNHGTITILDKYEVTTFRRDVSCDGRNATTEWAKTIEEDLSRRDVTMNAMAINLFTGELVDPFGGIQDIKDKIIRAVGNPVDRLNEDTLRVLRAVRFANRFGFNIEYNLANAIIDVSIDNLSVERIREEFMKILETRNDNYIHLIIYKVIPELKVLIELSGGNKHAETVDIHSLLTMRYVMESSYKPLNTFIALLHDIGKGFTFNDPEREFKGHEDIGAEKIKEIMTRMKFSNDEINYAYAMVKNHMRWHFFEDPGKEPTDRAIRRALRDLPDKFDKQEMMTDLLILTWVDSQANLLNEKESLSDYIDRKGIYRRALEMIRENPEVKVGSGLELNGNDLIEMGYKPGVLFNTILNDVLGKVIGEDESFKLENDKEVLKNYVMEKYKI